MIQIRYNVETKAWEPYVGDAPPHDECVHGWHWIVMRTKLACPGEEEVPGLPGWSFCDCRYHHAQGDRVKGTPVDEPCERPPWTVEELQQAILIGKLNGGTG